jgi:hypothetical protein
MRNNEPVGRTAAHATRGRTPAGRTARGQGTRRAAGTPGGRTARGQGTRRAAGTPVGRTARGQGTRRTAGTPVGRTARGQGTRRAAGTPVGRTARGQGTRRAAGTPVGRTARGQASGLCATQRRGAARAFAWPTSGARLDAQSRSQSASIDPRWVGGSFVAPSLRSPRRLSWWSTMRHRLGQANASPAPRRCVAQRPEACPLAVRPTGVPAACRLSSGRASNGCSCRASRALPSGRASNGCSCRASRALSSGRAPNGCSCRTSHGPPRGGRASNGCSCRASRDLSSGRADLRAPVAHHVGKETSTVSNQSGRSAPVTRATSPSPPRAVALGPTRRTPLRCTR